ncbi:uncharacterized protein LTR77_010318 [Saxophila tyrrhenica]|uniref:Peptidase S53 domain-containing protein n=1 Tax=Saxophila tyrrhenica TaxID=1690608 RepID=A0AAV9NVP9_9PEZI|nr:hypothetical protein LTR77_010318 [Saxophila tyrrhenica]
MRIALRQNNLEYGHDHLMDVSHPSSSNYGKHWSAGEAHDYFAPSDETVGAVKDWLLSYGIHENDIFHYENKGWLAVDLPASHAESMLNTEYFEYATSGSHRIGCDHYSLPAHLSDHVDFIKPGVKLSAPLKKRQVKRDGWPGGGYWGHGGYGGHGGPGWPGPPHFPAHHWPHWKPPHHAHGLPENLQACSVNITPVCIKALYNIPNARLSQPINVMGLFEEYDAFSQQDLNLFFKNYAPNVPQGTSPQVNSVDGGTAPVAAGSVRNSGESDIDLDLAYALIYPQTVTVYEVDDIPNASGEIKTAGFLNTFFDAVDGSYCTFKGGDSPIDPVYPDKHKGGYKGQTQCGTYELTRVLSISYGEAESEVPKRYMERQCLEIMKLGLQGHSLFLASGDYGVAGYPGEEHDKFGCLSGHGQNGTIYNPDSVSSCPYMTSVGATQLEPDQTIYDRESAMQINFTALYVERGYNVTSGPLDFFATGGGFSNYFTPPPYQQSAVADYLASHNSLPYYIANAAASNIGENGGVYNRGGRGYPDVSANGAFLLAYNNLTVSHFFGTSLSAPIFASVITLINEERTAIGKGPVGFVNPTLYEHPYVLNDIVNGSNPNCGSSGFQAAPGWDPVTGLGTPNYPKMLELFMSLP